MTATRIIRPAIVIGVLLGSVVLFLCWRAAQKADRSISSHPWIERRVLEVAGVDKGALKYIGGGAFDLVGTAFAYECAKAIVDLNKVTKVPDQQGYRKLLNHLVGRFDRGFPDDASWVVYEHRYRDGGTLYIVAGEFRNCFLVYATDP